MNRDRLNSKVKVSLYRILRKAVAWGKQFSV